MYERSIQRAISFFFSKEKLVKTRNVVITLSNFLWISTMKKNKMVAPKLAPEGFKVLYLARSNFGSAVEEGQQRPHGQGAEMSKY